MIIIYFNLWLSSNYLYTSQTFTSFGASWQLFFTFLNLINDQPYRRVNLSRPLIVLVTPVYGNTGTLYLRQASLIFPENMMTGRYNLFLYEGSWYHPITPLLFQKSWWILGFYRSLTVAVLFTVMMRLKHKTSWFRDGNLTDYVSLRESRFSQFESHHYHELCMC